MEIRTIQEMLFAVLPQWNYRIEKPFKQILDEGVSLEMYYCIQALRSGGGMLTMSELAQRIRVSKQQMTKMVNRLVEHGFMERVYDSSDRRIIKIKLTEKAEDYTNYFLEQKADCFKKLLEEMNPDDREDFKAAIETIIRVLSKLPYVQDSTE